MQIIHNVRSDYNKMNKSNFKNNYNARSYI